MRTIIFFCLWGKAISFLWAHKAPIVFATECDHLKTHLAEASSGNRFLLMTDFATHKAKEPIEVRDNLRFILQLSLLLMHSSCMPIVQLDTTYAQCLSQQDPDHDGVVQTLNLLRGFLQGGMGDICHYDDWVVEHNRNYNQSLSQIEQSVRFMDTFEVRNPLKIDDYYVGHLMNSIPYETQMTRNDSVSNRTYACSSHFLWVEDPNDAIHLCGVENPVGLLATDNTSYTDLLRSIERLNPLNHPGKITLIIRMRSIWANLPPLIDQIQKKKYNVLWCCDPMGIPSSLYHFLRLHQEKGTVAGGIWVVGRSVQTLDLVQCLSCFMKKNKLSRKKHTTWNRFSL